MLVRCLKKSVNVSFKNTQELYIKNSINCSWFELKQLTYDIITLLSVYRIVFKPIFLN
jgi:hypothetical protein